MSRGLLVWFAATLFVLYELVLNVLYGVMAPNVAKDLALSGASVALLGALFANLYGVMQIPGGVLYDRFNPRLILPAAVAVCAGGTVIFAAAGSLTMAGVGRGVTGLGAAMAFVGAGYLFALWFPRRFATALGMTELVACVGTAIAQPLAADLIQSSGWREVMTGAALIGAAIAAIALLLIRRPGGPAPAPVARQSLSQSLATVFGGRVSWLGALYAAGTMGVVFSFGVIWNLPMQRAFGVNIETAAGINGALFIGVGIGSAVLGELAGRLPGRLLLVLPPAIGAATLGALIYLPPLGDVTLVSAAMGLIGFCCGAQVIAYDVVARNMPPAARGAAIGMVNALAFFAAGLLQAVPGWFAQGEDLATLRSVLWVFPLVMTLAALIGFHLAAQDRQRFDTAQVP